MVADDSKLEQELNSAKMAFNVARISLTEACNACGSRAGAEERLMSKAEEYGVDHAVDQLVKNAPLFGLGQPASPHVLAKLRDALLLAHDASQRLDLAMASREESLCKKNPNRPKGIIVGGREVEIDMNRGTVRYRDNGQEEPLQFERIGNARVRDRETDRDN